MLVHKRHVTLEWKVNGERRESQLSIFYPPCVLYRPLTPPSSLVQPPDPLGLYASFNLGWKSSSPVPEGKPWITGALWVWGHLQCMAMQIGSFHLGTGPSPQCPHDLGWTRKPHTQWMWISKHRPPFHPWASRECSQTTHLVFGTSPSNPGTWGVTSSAPRLLLPNTNSSFSLLKALQWNYLLFAAMCVLSYYTHEDQVLISLTGAFISSHAIRMQTSVYINDTPWLSDHPHVKTLCKNILTHVRCSYGEKKFIFLSGIKSDSQMAFCYKGFLLLLHSLLS